MNKERDPKWINVKNDKLMVTLGLRAPLAEKYNFSKTNEEKDLLKSVKSKYSPRKERFVKKNIVARLVIHLKNETKSKTFRTTYSATICESNITDYINSHNIKKEQINHMYFNNKSYAW